VVLDPHTQRVTDLIVERGFLLTTDRVVPVDAVERAAGEDIYLSISSGDLKDYPGYGEAEFEEPAPDVKAGVYDRSDVLCWPGVYRMVCKNPVIPMVRREIREGISRNQVVIERETPVRNILGKIGNVDHLLVDPESGEVTHLVVRKGLLPYYPILPISKVKSVSDEAVTVSLSNDEVDALPRYRRRDATDIEAELRDRFDSSPFDFTKVEISIEGGIVLLVGWVPGIGAKRHAEAISRSVEGVIDVENELNTEIAVTTRVINALLSDPRTSLSAIGVENGKGVITLTGQVDSVEIYEAAEEIAAGQPGVLSVVNALEVEPDADTESLRAWWLSMMMLSKKVP
jgi:osmotically-inducible protein OsmY